MGAVSSVVNAVSDVASGVVGAVRDVTGGAYDVAHDVGSSINNAVKDNIPGGWGGVAAITAAAMGMPEGLSSLGGEATLAAGAGDAMAADVAAMNGLEGVTVGGPMAGSSLVESAIPSAAASDFGYLGADAAQNAANAAASDLNFMGDVGMNVGEGADINAMGDVGMGPNGTPTSAAAGTGLGSLLSNALGSTGLTGAGALTGAAGLAGLLSLIKSDNARYGTPGRQNYTGPLSQYKFNPATYQASAPNPAMFRPQGGVTTVADQQRMQQMQPQVSPFAQMMAMGGGQQSNPMEQMARLAGMNFASGGSTSKRPEYKSKPQLAAMDPWTRAAAEYQNAAYRAQSPTAPTAAPTGPQLGQLNLKSGGELGGYSDGGRMLKGPGDGMSDSIPATIGGKRPARLADGEFVVPADVVSHLGNGSTEAGARELYKMMDKVRHARTGNKKQGKQIHPGKFLPK